MVTISDLLPEKDTTLSERFPVNLTEGRSLNETKALQRGTDYLDSQSA